MTVPIAALAATLLVAAWSLGAAATPAWRTTTLFAAAGGQAFIDNTDSSGLGAVNNPFGTRTGAGATGGSESTNGPFPGDQALFTFALYADRNLTTRVGTATYTCNYYFGKNGFCDAIFKLNRGGLTAFGTLNFTASSFALAITGGYGKYAGAVGDLDALPSGRNALRLAFTLATP